MRRLLVHLAVCVAAFSLLGTGLGQACDNPVWEYAMLNWRQHSHLVYYLHEGARSMRDRAANRILQQKAAGEGSHTNLVYHSVNVRQLAPDASKLLGALVARHANGPLPTHVVLTPRWDEEFVGRLTPRDARALVDSSKRRQLARMLTGGKQGVLLVLLGDDEARNAAVQAQGRRAIEMGEEYGWDAGLLEVARGEPGEQWLVRQLLSVRPGLSEVSEAMVFGAFGRGHIEGPHVGPYTDASYLLELVAFMNGPCTCMINPLASGLDLVTTWDWEARTRDWVPIAERSMDPGGFITF